ncbi:TonB-dependent receptor [Ekhidna sp.]|jgi:TonB-dependent receptor|uniref:TonB-dependent receptor n=1 Tax=Ekhidna sp. TaxID=2608089 RepID=UPI0032EB3713
MRHVLFIFLIVTFNAFSQQGTIRGTVIEDTNGEPLFGVTVQIKGTTNGAITDFDGKFEIKAAPGTYDLQASFVSFQTVVVSGLAVEPEEVTLIDQIRLKEDVELLDEVVVTAEVIKTTEAALMTVKRKSASLVDGISAASFRKIGDSDAASAAKRITGVSVEGGKYVYVRGLGDRYTKTQLNGMDVPGLDPDRNSIQMDIFPTNVLNNIIVSKTFTADLPADFTGGLVNIETKDIPDIKTTTAQVGFGYNPSMHFNADYLTYEGGKTDWLGFDDGTRELHVGDNELFSAVDVATAGQAEQSQIEAQQAGFNKQLGAMRERSFMDFNLGFSTGNQKEIGIGTLGYNFALTYRNSTEYYDDALFAQYFIRTDQQELVQISNQEGEYGVNNTLLGGLVGLGLKRDKSKYRINLLKIQNGESKTGSFDFEIFPNTIASDFVGVQNNLEFSQKSLTNLFVSGEYFLDSWTLGWRISPTKSSIYDPDIRFTKYEVLLDADDNPRGFDIGTGNSGVPVRIWRDLNETNLSSRVDAAKEYDINGRDAKLKVGAGVTLKNRDFIIREFNLNVEQDDFIGNYDELLYEENLYPSENGNIYYPQYIGGNVNQFDASVSNYSFYASNEFFPFDRFKAIVGVRAEAYQQKYTGENQQNIVLDNETVIDEFNLFPSTNFTYQISENQNLRFAYNRTIARYSFKEASFIEYFDPLTGRTFLGALSPIEDPETRETIWDGNIKSTLIDNFDVRWERFGDRAQILSISGFYKKFSDPIEIVQIASANNNFQPQNVGDATVYGAELEFRQSLGHIDPSLSDFFINGNGTWTVSQITMTDIEYEARQRNAKSNENVDRERELQGQAPYIINTGLSYAGQKNGLEIGLYYNVQGPTLTYTGGPRGAPDVYSIPFSSVNFSAIKNFGENDKMRLTFRVNNILNDKREWEYQAFDSKDQIFEARSPGTRVSLGFRYSF